MKWDIPGLEGRLTPSEAADLLEVKVRTLADWRRRKVGPPFVRLSNGRVSYMQEEVEAFGRVRKKAPEITGRKEKPLLQKRLDRLKADKEALVEDNRRLVDAGEQRTRRGLQLEEARREMESRVLEAQQDSKQWQHHAELLEGRLKKMSELLKQTELELTERNEMMVMLMEGAQEVLARYERENEAGRVASLPMLFPGGDSAVVSEARKRLLVLYSGVVRTLDGRLEALAGRKPSEAAFENSGAQLFMDGLSLLLGK